MIPEMPFSQPDVAHFLPFYSLKDIKSVLVHQSYEIGNDDFITGNLQFSPLNQTKECSNYILGIISRTRPMIVQQSNLRKPAEIFIFIFKILVEGTSIVL